jgi:hypothetical protein
MAQYTKPICLYLAPSRVGVTNSLVHGTGSWVCVGVHEAQPSTRKVGNLDFEYSSVRQLPVGTMIVEFRQRGTLA